MRAQRSTRPVRVHARANRPQIQSWGTAALSTWQCLGPRCPRAPRSATQSLLALEADPEAGSKQTLSSFGLGPRLNHPLLGSVPFFGLFSLCVVPDGSLGFKECFLGSD